jgi:hypothetical protein
MADTRNIPGTHDTIARARRAAEARAQSFRERALKLFPWVCARCGREFTRRNVRELTVHHRDHNHDNNPEDGSNWELLCIYCHEDEHARHLQAAAPARPGGNGPRKSATYKPFADLKSKLNVSER